MDGELRTIVPGAMDEEPANALRHDRATTTHHASQIAVWDLGVRLSHWLIVGSVVAVLVTGFFGPRQRLDVHIVLGTAVAALIAFRVVWGFTGSTHARFASFAVGPSVTVRYLSALIAGRAGRHVGHNPLGAMMIVALLLVLGLLTATGLVALGGELKEGPLAPFTSFAAGYSARQVHQALAIGLLGLIMLHIAGVMIESFRTGENLVRSMLTGRKAVASACMARAPEPGHPRIAAAMLALTAIGAAPLIAHHSRLPGLGVPTAPLDPIHAKECGVCHSAHHPSLAPAATWRAIMASLGDHFGENASLDRVEATGLLDYLTANSAEHWDTEAANRLRTPDTIEPLRITATPGWKRIHRDIPEAAFSVKTVGGKLNCAACHGDASSGGFAPRAIAIPKGTTAR